MKTTAVCLVIVALANVALLSLSVASADCSYNELLGAGEESYGIGICSVSEDASYDGDDIAAGIACVDVPQIRVLGTPIPGTPFTTCVLPAGVRPPNSASEQERVSVCMGNGNTSTPPCDHTISATSTSPTCITYDTAQHANEDFACRVTGPTPFTLTGRVTDGDGLVEVTGLLGVPSVITATTLAADCVASISALTSPEGAYVLSLPCAGTYAVEATPLEAIATHWNTTTSTVTFPASGSLVNLDLPVTRTTGSLTAIIQGTCTTLDPTPLDSATDVAPRTCGPGFSRFFGIHWGTYTLTPSRAGTPGPTTPAFVRPGADTQAFVISP